MRTALRRVSLGLLPGLVQIQGFESKVLGFEAYGPQVLGFIIVYVPRKDTGDTIQPR